MIHPAALRVFLVDRTSAGNRAALELSEAVLLRVQRVPMTWVLLDGVGHYPLEQPGLTHLAETISTFIRTLPIR